MQKTGLRPEKWFLERRLAVSEKEKVKKSAGLKTKKPPNPDTSPLRWGDVSWG
jgi:hypothetical protein